jgi:hypothetical protein
MEKNVQPEARGSRDGENTSSLVPGPKRSGSFSLLPQWSFVGSFRRIGCLIIMTKIEIDAEMDKSHVTMIAATMRPLVKMMTN